MRNYVEIIAKNIERLLKEAERKPAWLAKKSGVKPSNISRLLNLEANPTLETITAIAEAFDLEPNDLLKANEGSEKKDSWDNTNLLEQEVLALRTKMAKLEVAFNDEIDPQKIEQILKTRRLIDEEIGHLKGRINVLNGWKKKKEKPKSNAEEKGDNELIIAINSRLPSLDDSQLGLVLDLIDGFTPGRSDFSNSTG